MVILYDNRIEMVRDLIPECGTYGEIGVFKGEFASALHKLLDPSKIVLFDLFTGRTGSGDQDGNNFSHVSLDDVFKTLKADGRFELEKGDSSSNLSKYPDNYFDMIYVDGDHSYEGCKRDLVVAYSKVKPNGYILGHDYELNMKKAQTAWEFGVRQAVDEFCVQTGQTIKAKGLDGCVSYAIQVCK